MLSLLPPEFFSHRPTYSLHAVSEACTSQAFAHCPSSSWVLSRFIAALSLCSQKCWLGSSSGSLRKPRSLAPSLPRKPGPLDPGFSADILVPAYSYTLPMLYSMYALTDAFTHFLLWVMTSKPTGVWEIWAVSCFSVATFDPLLLGFLFAFYTVRMRDWEPVTGTTKRCRQKRLKKALLYLAKGEGNG